MRVNIENNHADALLRAITAMRTHIDGLERPVSYVGLDVLRAGLHQRLDTILEAYNQLGLRT